MDEYDIGAAFKVIEDELIASMIRNMDRHRAEEVKEGYNWSMWQAEQLKALEKYKRNNQRRYKGKFKDLNRTMEELIRQSRIKGNMQQEIRILQAIKKGWKVYGTNKSPVHQDMTAEFFRLNDRKLETLIKATMADMETAETAVLRKANDDYRKAIFNAQVYANTGAGTYEKAVDMATKDMLSRGLNCIVYANGARHTLADYADMAIRTASKRAYLQGEGEKRQEWGVATVIVNKRGNPCPKCLPFVGKVLIDDVWSGGSKKDGNYPLMSYAIERGLFHPRCKDSHTTYFPGISTADDAWTKEELEAIEQANQEEVKQQYAERQTERFERLEKYSLDEENKRRYGLYAGEWKEKQESQNRAVDILSSHESFIEKLRSDDKASSHKTMMALYAETTEMVEDLELPAPFAYNVDEDVIKYNSHAPYISEYDMDYVIAHEITHRMDELEYHSWENEKFLRAIEICQQKVYDNQEQIQTWFEIGGKYEESFAISDIISALSNGEIDVPIGHKREYWDIDQRFKPMEIFANLSSIDVLGLGEKEEILQELFEAYEELIG